jgi:ABC-type antimicrobial peptide transport system permease subunit
VAGIAIGIAVVVMLLIVADGLSGQLSAIMTSSGAEITVMQAEVADISFSILPETLGGQLEAIPQVAWVSPLLMQILPAEEKMFFIVVGTDPEAPSFQHFHLIEGAEPASAGEVFLGRMAADFFDKSPGDTLTLQSQELRVSGIYESGVGFEDGGAVIPLIYAQELFKREGQVSFFQIKVRPENLDDLDEIVDRIRARYPQVAAYRSSEFGENTPDIQTLQMLAGVVSLIGLTAGALGTMNTMLMSVFERTREIGTLRAIGWRKGRVLRIIMGESLLLSVIGGILGIAFGSSIVSLINISPEFRGFFSQAQNAEAAVLGIIVAILLGLLGGLYPAWRAMRLLPIEALRYE